MFDYELALNQSQQQLPNGQVNQYSLNRAQTRGWIQRLNEQVRSRLDGQMYVEVGNLNSLRQITNMDEEIDLNFHNNLNNNNNNEIQQQLQNMQLSSGLRFFRPRQFGGQSPRY